MKLNLKLANLCLCSFLLLTSSTLIAQTTVQTPPQQAAAAKSATAGDIAINWNQWRGPRRDGKLAGVSWPEKLDDSQLKKVWSVSLGPSYSGPIVVGDRVYTTQTIDKTYEAVTAHDRKTGEKIWEQTWKGAMEVPFFAKANGDWIRATPAYSQGRLYVAGIRDVLVCLDADSGEEVWRVDFPAQMNSALPKFGCASSPLVDGKFVYVQAGGAFFKIDKENGKVVWKAAEGGSGMDSAFSSPIIAKLKGIRQILVQTRSDLVGIDLEQGKVLWKQPIPAFRGMNIITPTVVDDDKIFVSSYGGKTKVFDVGKTGDEFQLAERWMLPADGYMTSPVIVDGFAYTHLRNQRFACFDVNSGEETWRTGAFGKYASLIANDDKILALDQRGELMLIKANPEKFELLDKRKVGTDNWAHLAVQGDEIIVRGLRDLTVYKWTGVTAKPKK
jgi:outer membrane protein assembly factor BamB